MLVCLQETAINIGYACSLITDDMTQFQMQGACLEVDKLEAEGRVSRLRSRRLLHYECRLQGWQRVCSTWVHR
jgi:hypothetical protein